MAQLTPLNHAAKLRYLISQVFGLKTDDKKIIECIIIMVEEILKIVPSVYVTNDEEIHIGHYQYWYNVKEELEKKLK
jgi:hypothetical protein